MISCLLLFAGIGSITQVWAGRNAPARIRLAAPVIGLVCLIYLLVLDKIFLLLLNVPIQLKFSGTALLLLPPGYFLCFFFSPGIDHLQKQHPGLVSLAWGVNGFASVAAAPLAILLFMGPGYPLVMLMAAVLYPGCVLLFFNRPRKKQLPPVD